MDGVEARVEENGSGRREVRAREHYKQRTKEGSPLMYHDRITGLDECHTGLHERFLTGPHRIG